jgi:serine phosphatase RsbU (regulator of sigma subunit)
MLGWLQEHARPLVRDEIDSQRLADLRGPIEQLFESHEAEVLVPLVNRDEIVGMLTLGALSTRRALRSDELRLLARTQEHAAAALVYARMHAEATKRVEVDKEVGLAAAVQSAFIPRGELVKCADVTLSGAYQPASRCGGDWWSVSELPGERVLVLIGDVTGHGIPAAMVTAAAKGCYDVAQRLMGDDLDVVRLLDYLDDAVRLAGGEQFYMTCFATLLDPPRGQVTYANAGHVVPYLCRPRSDGGVDLDALVARGNPLGTAEKSEYRALTREIASGDVLIWYTDGIVECTNPQRRQFGDRRMQRMLRRIEGPRADVQAIRNNLVRAAVAFQEGHPADDDITLVVGRIG